MKGPSRTGKILIIGLVVIGVLILFGFLFSVLRDYYVTNQKRVTYSQDFKYYVETPTQTLKCQNYTVLEPLNGDFEPLYKLECAGEVYFLDNTIKVWAVKNDKNK